MEIIFVFKYFLDVENQAVCCSCSFERSDSKQGCLQQLHRSAGQTAPKHLQEAISRGHRHARSGHDPRPVHLWRSPSQRHQIQTPQPGQGLQCCRTDGSVFCRFFSTNKLWIVLTTFNFRLTLNWKRTCQSSGTVQCIQSSPTRTEWCFPCRPSSMETILRFPQQQRIFSLNAQPPTWPRCAADFIKRNKLDLIFPSFLGKSCARHFGVHVQQVLCKALRDWNVRGGVSQWGKKDLSRAGIQDWSDWSQ